MEFVYDRYHQKVCVCADSDWCLRAGNGVADRKGEARNRVTADPRYLEIIVGMKPPCLRHDRRRRTDRAVALLAGPELSIEKVTENLFVIAGGDAGNTAVSVRADGVVLADTKVPGNGQRILDLVRTVTDRRITHILDSHTHRDHVRSNSSSGRPSRW